MALVKSVLECCICKEKKDLWGGGSGKGRDTDPKGYPSLWMISLEEKISEHF
jgi:hypothetical protein